MWHRWPLVVLICSLAIGFLLHATATAGEGAFLLKGWAHRRLPDYWGNPQGVSVGPPGPHRYPEYNVSYPWYGYGFGVPTYRWGYFGVRYRPGYVCHKGYHDDFTQWGYRSGY